MTTSLTESMPVLYSVLVGTNIKMDIKSALSYSFSFLDRINWSHGLSRVENHLHKMKIEYICKKWSGT